jgi:hypothetical protein
MQTKKELDELVATALNLVLANCVEDTAYNDNTIYDLLRYGFKGYVNMTEEELNHEIDVATKWQLGN